LSYYWRKRYQSSFATVELVESSQSPSFPIKIERNSKQMSDLQGKRVLIVDDDPDLLQLLKIYYTKAKAQVYSASNGMEGLRQFYTCQPDLVILDLMMPQMDGWEVCRNIRLLSNLPLIILTALGQDRDIIRGLDSGATAYVTKPVTPEVLLARSRAALRQVTLTVESQKSHFYSDDYLTINLNNRQVYADGKPIELSGTEYRLLAYLVQNSTQVLTASQILEKVWGWEYRDNTSYLHVYMSHLRRKLEKNPREPQYLCTEHGVGYRFNR
jgi:DNA-binding response OmpR family regulator